jgi:glycine/D-amino acid oxidase-like deaminating enzyme
MMCGVMQKNLKKVNVAVIGCGIFGAEIALKAKSYGLSVEVYEAKNDILSGASANNQNRLHLGFHYPRDLETGKQSIRGFDAFKQKYSECIQDGFLNAYFIANEGSLTTPGDFLKFCEQLGAPYKTIVPNEFPVAVQCADTGILCEEVVYDCGILRDLIWQHLRRDDINVVLGERAVKIAKNSGQYLIDFAKGGSVLADVIINASYCDINRLTEQLGHTVTERLFEYTAVPIIELDMPKVGVTIMDGPFMTVLPYGKTENFLLYNVEHTLVAKDISSQMDPTWLTPESAPFTNVDKLRYFEKMIALCKKFVPLIERAKVVGFLEGPRMVLARKEDSDARPSIVTSYDGDGYFTVFAGKIDHCMWVANDVGQQLKAKFNL